MKRGQLQESGSRAGFGLPAPVRAPRPGAVVFLVTAALALTACGPTAEQARERAVISASPADPAPPVQRPSPAQVPTMVPEPAPTPTPTPEPLKVGVAGSQLGMSQPVQDACQFLLRRDPARMPAEEAGECIKAAMTAGTGGTQTLTTSSSWIPEGTHTVEFTTAPDFSLVLESPDTGLRVTAGAGGGSVDTGGGKVSANESGTPEESYAAVLAHAAELTVNPDRVAEMLGTAGSFEVDYSAVLDGTVRTKITGHRTVDAAADDMTPAGITLWLDDWYRPVRFELTGQTRGIASSITADNGAWAS